MSYRMQNKEWWRHHDDYSITSFEISSNGNIKINCINKHHEKPIDVCHWLNDYEKKKFVKSDYFKSAYRDKKPNSMGHYKYRVLNDMNRHKVDLTLPANRSLVKLRYSLKPTKFQLELVADMCDKLDKYGTLVAKGECDKRWIVKKFIRQNANEYLNLVTEENRFTKYLKRKYA